MLSAFVIIMIYLTHFKVNDVKKSHEIKNMSGYVFDPNDFKFETTRDIMKLCFYCMIAAGLCGMTGIAGGMVLGPLFLTYGMIP